MSEQTKDQTNGGVLGKASSRRDFIRKTALSALVGGAAAACSIDESRAQQSKVNEADHSGGSMAPNPAPVSAAAAAEAMDKMHEAGIKAFPAKTAGKGNQLLKPRIEKGVKIFDITAKKNSLGNGARADSRSMGLQRAGTGTADSRP